MLTGVIDIYLLIGLLVTILELCWEIGGFHDSIIDFWNHLNRKDKIHLFIFPVTWLPEWAWLWISLSLYQSPKCP